MKTSDEGRALIREFEGCELTAYPDPATGGDPWTIGVGHTGPEVHEGKEITEEDADALLAKDLARFEACVSDNLTVDVAQAQFDAMVSLAFNIGCANFRKSSVLRYTNEGNLEGAKEAFRLWDKAAGKKMAGLTRRRAAEAEMFGSA